MPLRAAMPKSISLTVPSVVIITLLGLTSRCTMRAFSNTYCRPRHTRLVMKTLSSTSGRQPRLAVALEVLDEAPAVDVLEDDAQLPVHPLEVEDAADVLVVENGVPPRLLDEEAQVLGLGRLELLDDDRPLEAGLPQEEALAHGAHAAGAQLVEDAVLRLGQSGVPRGRLRRIAEPPGGVKAAEPDAILAGVRVMALDVGDVRIGVALSDETGTLASGLVTLRSVGPRKDAQALAALAREHDVGEVVVGLPLRLDGSLGSQAEKVLAFVERLRRVAAPSRGRRGTSA